MKQVIQSFTDFRNHDHKPPTIEITEKWIEEKAVEIYNYLYYKTFNLDQVRGFIRLLVKEWDKIKGE